MISSLRTHHKCRTRALNSEGGVLLVFRSWVKMQTCAFSVGKMHYALRPIRHMALLLLPLKGCFIDLHGGSDPFIHTNAFIGACSTEMRLLRFLCTFRLWNPIGVQWAPFSLCRIDAKKPSHSSRYGNGFHFHF